MALDIFCFAVLFQLLYKYVSLIPGVVVDIVVVGIAVVTVGHGKPNSIKLRLCPVGVELSPNFYLTTNTAGSMTTMTMTY